MARFVIRFLGRAWIGLVLAMAIQLLRDLIPMEGLLGALPLPVGVIVLVCSLGKALYDTLFFERYWP